MKICVWSKGNFEKWYSSYHLMHGLLLAMLEAGHEVWLVQPQYDTGKLPEDLAGNKNLHAMNIPMEKWEKANFAQRYLRGIQYYQKTIKTVESIPDLDVIFLQSTNNAYFPVRAARKMKVPIVFNVQDIFPIDALVIGKLTKRNPVFIVSRWQQAQAYKKASRVVTISEDLKKTIQAEGRQDVDVVYNWSYQNEPYSIPDAENHFLQSNNIRREDGFRVVYAGNVGQMMESETIIQSAILLKEHQDIKFYIIGEGSGLKRMKSRVEQEGLTNILFFGRQPMEYAPDNYCMADVNINPVPKGVMYTCMPSKTNTCLLSQKPTVVTMDLDSDMAKKLSGVDQWTVIAPGDAKAMADSILKYYHGSDWQHGEVVCSKDAGSFMSKLGPVENAREYVRILEEAAKAKK